METEAYRSQSPEGLAQICLQCYVQKDEATLQKIIAADFTFTSPLDNKINRQTYFERCWPNSKTTSSFEIISLRPSGDSVFVTYIGTEVSGRKFQNTEFITTRDGKITNVDVYFGWDIPHPAKEGSFVSERT